MTVDTTTPICEDTPIAIEGGLPTPAELERLSTALMDVAEFGLDRLRFRLAEAFVQAYEAPRESGNILDGCNFDYVGRYSARIHDFVDEAEHILSQVKGLAEYQEHLERAASEDGYVRDQPPFGRFGSRYEPSDEALRMWGLKK